MVDEEDFNYILTFDEIKQIFKEAKQASRDDEDRLEHSLELKVGGAIADAGRQGFYQFTDDIWAYINYPWDYIQEQAIQSLGYPHKIHDPNFRDEAYKIWHDGSRTGRCHINSRGVYFF
jgi:hypothetical protein